MDHHLLGWHATTSRIDNKGSTCTMSILWITHDVPQGSVLGPLLFCLHINDLPSCIQNYKIHMFADDPFIQCSSSSVVDLKHSLQKDLNAVQAYMNANKLKLNCSYEELFTVQLHICVVLIWWNMHVLKPCMPSFFVIQISYTIPSILWVGRSYNSP